MTTIINLFWIAISVVLGILLIMMSLVLVVGCAKLQHEDNERERQRRTYREADDEREERYHDGR